MTKDERLYARFDICMDEHPKIMLLSDAAFRAAIEATFFARRQLTDGFLHEGVVLKKWGRDIATELSTNHPERPTWSRVDGGWQIRDYEEHQTTRADIERKREAGRTGGRISASNRSTNRQARASETVERFSNDFQAKTETETETKTNVKELVQHKAERESDFNEFWSNYPRKQAKGDAVKAYNGARKKADAETILKGLQVYKLSVIGSDPQFVALPGSWLRAERWADEPVVLSGRERVVAVVERPTVSGLYTPPQCRTHGYPLPCPTCEVN